MIQKVLVANRGEIAVRIMRSCREMGIRTVAVFSEADRAARHVMYADEACCIGPAASQESYLNIDNIIRAAKEHKADAIHPGYGFLSENAEFARRCRQEGIIFVGPAPETMEAMGDKISARKRMIAAGVPVVPGTEKPLQSAEEALRVSKEIGFPVMLKASMGGGGKGMRLIHSEDEVVEAYNTARSESMSSFGDDTVYIEKFVEEPHHIEFQILGDNHGNVIHLFDRECSVQRRNQKIVEESPSPFLTPELRREMGEKAVAAARAVNYSGAGTIEFLVDKHRHFYFLEMNTRLQVEHPITEEVVGVDLVKEQIRVANDEVLHLRQEDLFQRGHAIECRICAEDTENNFMPSPGIIKQLVEPNGIGVRGDLFRHLGRGDAESGSHGETARPPDRFEFRGEFGRKRAAYSGDAADRDAVDETTAPLGNPRGAFRRCRRRNERNEVESVRFTDGHEFASLLHRQIYDKHAVDAGFF